MATHYPRSGQGFKWTVKELQAIPISWKGDRLNDSRGLFGKVRVSTRGVISVCFEHTFRWEGKICYHHCGTWPGAPLETIRENRDAARAAVKSGINPNLLKVARKIDARKELERKIEEDKQEQADNKTLRDMFNDWVADGVRRKDENNELKRSFEKDLLASHGDLLAKDVTEHHLREVLRIVVRRGSDFQAEKLCADLVQMFCWAELHQPWRRLMADGNPALLLEIDRIVSPNCNLKKVGDRVLSGDEIRLLDIRFREMDESLQIGKRTRTDPMPVRKETQLALWICLATLCRIGELLLAEWKHLNLAKRAWFIPEENVKGQKGKKQPHLIYLSDFALSQFQQLKQLTGSDQFCFPGRSGGHVDLKSVTKQVADRQVQFKHRDENKPRSNRCNANTLVLDINRGEWTPHDLRRTGSTKMQALGVPDEVVDRTQNHAIKGSKVRKSYLHYDFEKEQIAAWEVWGQALNRIIFNKAPPQRYSTVLYRLIEEELNREQSEIEDSRLFA